MGRNSATARSLAREHYIDYGYKETNRGIEVPSWDEIWYGGQSDYYDHSEISCDGTIHMGYTYSPLDHNELMTFEQMRDFKTTTRKSFGDWTWCTIEEF